MIHPFPSLLSLLGGETLGIEYKRDLDAKNKKGPLAESTLAESLMAIGNAHGGYLLLGIEDRTAKVLGLNADRKGSLNALRDAVRRKFTAEPPIAVHEERQGGHRVYLLHWTSCVSVFRKASVVLILARSVHWSSRWMHWDWLALWMEGGF